MTLIEQLQRFISPLKEKIMSMVGCSIIRSVTDGNGLQVLKASILKEELKSGIERIQEYGFTSHPPEGSEAVITFPQGNREFGIVIATDSSRYRIRNLPEGAVAIYNRNGDYVKLTKEKIEIHAKEITLGDGSSFKKLINEEFQSMFNGHVHTASSFGSATTTPQSSTSYPASVAIGNNEMTSKTKAE